MISLGRLKIKNQFMLAPMSMYSDVGLRKICYEYGCAYAFTEQIHTAEFLAKNEIVKRKIDLFDEAGIQFLTNNVSELKETIRIVNDKEFYPNLKNVKSIDLNIGCPTQDIMNEKMGAALLKEPRLVKQLFHTMRETSFLPVSAKIRIAVDAKHKKTKPYMRIAKIAQEEKLDFLTVHLRSAGQKYSGDVDLGVLKEIRENVDIPLVGNGGIIDEKTAEKMLEYCDAVMIGQYAVQNPFIFKKLNYYFDKKEKLHLNVEREKLDCIKKYFLYAEKYNIGFQHVKIHTQAFLKGLGKEKLITKLTHTKNIGEIKKEMLNHIN